MTRVQLGSGSHRLLMCEQNGVRAVEETYKTSEIREKRWANVKRQRLDWAEVFCISSAVKMHYIYIAFCNIWIFVEETVTSSG